MNDTFHTSFIIHHSHCLPDSRAQARQADRRGLTFVRGFVCRPASNFSKARATPHPFSLSHRLCLLGACLRPTASQPRSLLDKARDHNDTPNTASLPPSLSQTTHPSLPPTHTPTPQPTAKSSSLRQHTPLPSLSTPAPDTLDRRLISEVNHKHDDHGACPLNPRHATTLPPILRKRTTPLTTCRTSAWATSTASVVRSEVVVSVTSTWVRLCKSIPAWRDLTNSTPRHQHHLR